MKKGGGVAGCEINKKMGKGLLFVKQEGMGESLMVGYKWQTKQRKIVARCLYILKLF